MERAKKIAKNGKKMTKIPDLFTNVTKRPKLRKSGAWSLSNRLKVWRKVMLKIWYYQQLSNFGDGISFGH